MTPPPLRGTSPRDAQGGTTQRVEERPRTGRIVMRRPIYMKSFSDLRLSYSPATNSA